MISHSFGGLGSVGTMVYEVKGKVFLVTGAANGIGAWFVRDVVQEDAKVCKKSFLVLRFYDRNISIRLRTSLIVY